jgi:putative Mg2+ transporter-C (MgtC) family protein
MISTTEILIRFSLALLWGGLVGAEQEFRGKNAGFRTTIMISIGACFFTLISVTLGAPASMDRIAANIVTGIGFLGAGVIFKYENRVNGITTASTIWGVSAVAMGIGAGYYFPSGFAAFLILFTLVVLPYVDRTISKNYHFTIVRVECIKSDEVLKNLEDSIANSGLKFDLISQRWDKETVALSWKIKGKEQSINSLIVLLRKNPLVNKLDC